MGVLCNMKKQHTRLSKKKLLFPVYCSVTKEHIGYMEDESQIPKKNKIGNKEPEQIFFK